jgi:hypothetical protein
MIGALAIVGCTRKATAVEPAAYQIALNCSKQFTFAETVQRIRQEKIADCDTLLFGFHPDRKFNWRSSITLSRDSWRVEVISMYGTKYVSTSVGVVERLK